MLRSEGLETCGRVFRRGRETRAERVDQVRANFSLKKPFAVPALFIVAGRRYTTQPGNRGAFCVRAGSGMAARDHKGLRNGDGS